jgi:hypothetical protein
MRLNPQDSPFSSVSRTCPSDIPCVRVVADLAIMTPSRPLWDARSHEGNRAWAGEVKDGTKLAGLLALDVRVG